MSRYSIICYIRVRATDHDCNLLYLVFGMVCWYKFFILATSLATSWPAVLGDEMTRATSWPVTVHTCQSVPNVFINLRILVIVPNLYMSVFAHQKPIYLLPSVNIPVKAVSDQATTGDYHTFVQNTLIFLLNLRKFWLRLIVEVSGQSQLIGTGIRLRFSYKTTSTRLQHSVTVRALVHKLYCKKKNVTTRWKL